MATKKKAQKKAKTKPDPEWQKLFDAYWLRASWLPPSWSKLNKRERMAVSLGFFYGQMRGNGAQFWITNGHADSCGQEILERLRDLDSPCARDVAEIVKELDVLAGRAEQRENELADLEDAPDEPDPVLEELAERCCELDAQYQSLSPTLMGEVDAWLLANPGRSRG